MRRMLIATLFATAATGAAAQTSPQVARLAAIVAPVSGAQIKATVEKLVSFGTRHTLSSQTDPKRGIGASLKWTEREFGRYSKACGGCLTIVSPSDTVTGRRVPTPTLVRNMVAIQRGTQRPNDVVIITGHIDSRVTDPMNATSDAPGANDDGSGTAAVIEAARVLSRHKFPGTIVFAALSGEEQGLLGSQQDPRDQAINSQAIPLLRSQALSAQSAKIDGVSGATFTSEGYITSLQSALDAAGFGR